MLNQRYSVIKSLNQSGSIVLAWDTHRSPPVQCVLQQVQTLNLSVVSALLETLSAHPQLPTLLDWFEESESAYLVWECVSGQNLEERLTASGQFTAAQVVQLLLHALPVLQFLHHYGVLHGHLNPTSLIYRASDRLPVLVGFNPIPLNLKATASVLSGDPEYAAPEQLHGNATDASDLYSLGVICLHLLTDLRPFDLLDAVQQRWAWRTYWTPNDADPADSKQREQLAQFLEQLSDFNLEQRFSSAELALRTLQTLNLKPDLKLNFKPNLKPDLKPQNQPAQVVQNQPSVNPSASNTPSFQTKSIACLTGHSGLRAAVNTVAISLDAQVVASGSDDKTVRLWQVATGQTVGILQAQSAVKAVCFSPNGKILAAGADRTILLWSVATQQLLATLTGHSQAVTALQFSPDEQRLVSGSADKTVRLWSLQSHTVLASLSRHRLAVTAVAFSPIAPLLATASLDRTVRLWNLSTLQPIALLDRHTRAVRTVAFSPSGRWLATGGDDNLIHLWDLSQGNPEPLATLTGHSWSVTGLAFLTDCALTGNPSIDRVMLASGSWDKTIKLWQIAGGATAEATAVEATAVLAGHTDSICAISAQHHLKGAAAAAESGSVLIASGSQDRTVRLWCVND